jgi:hypothetical protein
VRVKTEQLEIQTSKEFAYCCLWNIGPRGKTGNTNETRKRNNKVGKI